MSESAPPVPPQPEPPYTDPWLGRTLGSYRPVRQLGSGGIGTVYLAEHLRIGNQAAIKLLREEISACPAAMQRFLIEAQAQSRIAHPGVALLFDFAQPQGESAYLVMEYVAGESLRERLQRGQLAIPEAVNMILQVAETLAAAHAVGVVHRDLKPANLMQVPLHDGRVIMKVLDFGLARITLAAEESNPSVSVTGETILLGTPKYMAPEQGVDPHDVDGQSDVYSLGAVAFEALTGRPPFTAGTAWELLTHHLRSVPPSVGELVPAAPQALVELIAEMLAKSPVARPTMVQVVARLRKLSPLAEATTDRRVRPMATRWRAALLAGAVLLACGLGGLGVYAYQQKGLVAARQSEALEAADQLLAVVARQLQPVPGAETAVRDLLATSGALLEKAQTQAPDDLRVQEALARMYLLRGDLRRTHGSLNDAFGEYEQAIAVSERLVANSKRKDTHLALQATAYASLGSAYEHGSQPLLAKSAYARGLAIREALQRAAPKAEQPILDAVSSYLQLGDLERSMGHSESARTLYEHARETIEPSWKRDPDRRGLRWNMCGVMYRLSAALLLLGRTTEAMSSAEQALDVLLRLAPAEAQRASYNQLHARMLQVRGDAAARLGRLARAERDYQESAAILDARMQLLPNDHGQHRSWLDGQIKVAEHALRLGKVRDAEPVSARALQAAEALMQVDAAHQGHKWRLILSLQLVGDVALRQGRVDAARKSYTRAIEVLEALVLSAKDNTRHRERLAELYARLADAAAEGIAPAAALPHYEKALRMARELSGQDPQNTTLRLAIAHLYRQLGTLHARQGQPDEARASYEQARSFARAVAAADAADATAQLAQTAAEVGLASLSLALDAPTHAERARLAARLTALARIEPEGKDPLISELMQALQGSPAATPRPIESP